MLSSSSEIIPHSSTMPPNWATETSRERYQLSNRRNTVNFCKERRNCWVTSKVGPKTLLQTRGEVTHQHQKHWFSAWTVWESSQETKKTKWIYQKLSSMREKVTWLARNLVREMGMLLFCTSSAWSSWEEIDTWSLSMTPTCSNWTKELNLSLIMHDRSLPL